MPEGRAYRENIDVVDDYSAKIYAELKEWARERDASWEWWAPGYLLARLIPKALGEHGEPALLWTADREITVAFGDSIFHPFDASVQTQDGVVSPSATDLIDGWLSGAIRVLAFFGPEGAWLGSLPLYEDDEGDDIEDEYPFPGDQTRAELRAVDRRAWQYFNGGPATSPPRR